MCVLLLPDVNRDGLWWIAQGLEYNIAVQARSPLAAIEEFIHTIKIRLYLEAEYGADPFENIIPAPKRHRDTWANNSIQTTPIRRRVEGTDWQIEVRIA
jgi:hypothetical protein